MTWISTPNRFLFFTGKGGVGKTSLACATAIALADAGKRVLLVSTDPASNLDHVFSTSIDGATPTPIDERPGLEALNIDPEAAAQAYRDRIVGPVRETLPADVVRRMEEELSGACTTEIAAFDEFTAILTDATATAEYDHVIFDTAPTGHTLRLLSLPSAWSGFLEHNDSGASCLGPLSGLAKQRDRYRAAVDTLADATRTTVLLVSRPQSGALHEAARTSDELRGLGVANQRLIVNGVMPDHEGAGRDDDPLAEAMRARDRRALEAMPEALAPLSVDIVPLQASTLMGVDALRAMVSGQPSTSTTRTQTDDGDETTAPSISDPTLGELLAEIEAAGHGLVMVMGKGGVGKTTVAAAVAVELASRGHTVHLTTTDPAAHLSETVAEEIEHLAVSRIDPKVETQRYREHVLETKGAGLDDAARALLEEDLRSPCTEEIAVFQAFSKAIREAQQSFVVMDTAPTGHTLLLLDATGSYHRDVTRHAKPGMRLTTPMMRLQDPAQTKILIVTLAETTPVLEAAALQEDLRRAGIEPWAWVINASLAAAGPTDALLVARSRAEVAQIARVRDGLATRLAVIPWAPSEPIGVEALRSLCGPTSPSNAPLS